MPPRIIVMFLDIIGLCFHTLKFTKKLMICHKFHTIFRIMTFSAAFSPKRNINLA